jgi:hypothetical protein
MIEPSGKDPRERLGTCFTNIDFPFGKGEDGKSRAFHQEVHNRLAPRVGDLDFDSFRIARRRHQGKRFLLPNPLSDLKATTCKKRSDLVILLSNL